jgi:hypothetical protein
MPPAYVKRHKNDAANVEAICEAMCVPKIRFYNIGDEGRPQNVARTALLLTRLLLLSLPEQISQGGIDSPLVNVAPERTIGSRNPISPVFPHDLDAVYRSPFPSFSRRNEREVR